MVFSIAYWRSMLLFYVHVKVWEVMNPAERCKQIQCVIIRITVYENHIEIRPNLDGIKTLLAEAGMEV